MRSIGFKTRLQMVEESLTLKSLEDYKKVQNELHNGITVYNYFCENEKKLNVGFFDRANCSEEECTNCKVVGCYIEIYDVDINECLTPTAILIRRAYGTFLKPETLSEIDKICKENDI